jgi:hypothetical protein
MSPRWGSEEINNDENYKHFVPTGLSKPILRLQLRAQPTRLELTRARRIIAFNETSDAQRFSQE